MDGTYEVSLALFILTSGRFSFILVVPCSYEPDRLTLSLSTKRFEGLFSFIVLDLWDRKS